MILYHLDRSGLLNRGTTIDLIPNHLLPQDLKGSQLIELLGGRLSSHGINYMNPTYDNAHYRMFENQIYFSADAVQSQLNIANNRIMELGLELVRQAHFPHCPSRLQCFYGLGSIEEFALWPELQTAPINHIVEFIAPDDTPRFDAQWLRGGLIQEVAHGQYYFAYAPTFCFDFAYKYWSGIPSEHPRWEYLVSLPISVINVRNIPRFPQTAPEHHQP